MDDEFKLTTGPRTPAAVLDSADTVERQIGEIANGRRKPANISVEDIAVLVQHARNTKGQEQVDTDVMQASCADSGTSNVKFHVVTEEGKGAYRYLATACGTGKDGTTIMSSDTKPAHTVAMNNRCRKQGCRTAFAIADSYA